jgi:hypothetical protein
MAEKPSESSVHPAEAQTGGASRERIRQIRQQLKETDGFTGGPDKRKRDGKFMCWCHYCVRFQDDGHEDDCVWLMVRDLLGAVPEGRETPGEKR